MQVDSPPSPDFPPPSCSDLPTFTSSHPSLSLLSARQETILLTHLTKTSVATGSPRASRLQRKLKMRQRQRNHGHSNFDLDYFITRCLSSTVKYVINEEKPYSDQIIPVVQKVPPPSPSPPSHTYHSVLRHVSFPLLAAICPTTSTRLTAFLSGRDHSLAPIASPYTARLLKPYIFRSEEIRPPQVRNHHTTRISLTHARMHTHMHTRTHAHTPSRLVFCKILSATISGHTPTTPSLPMLLVPWTSATCRVPLSQRAMVSWPTSSGQWTYQIASTTLTSRAWPSMGGWWWAVPS